jgi:predicted permease
LTVPNPANGDQTGSDTNRRYFFTMDAADGVNQVVFNTTRPAFEFDNIAAAISGVPEPQTWAMMILGFGFIGFMLRNGRRQAAAIV